MSRYFEGLIRELLATTERPDATEANLLCSAWEAINVLIHTAAPDVFPLVGQLVPAFLDKLKATLSSQVYMPSVELLFVVCHCGIFHLGIFFITTRVMFNFDANVDADVVCLPPPRA